jgi:hypothetical protein
MAKTTSNRKTVAKKSVGQTAIDPATLPEQYALSVVGDCMMPTIKGGARAIFSKAEKYGPGDIVVIWFQPEHIKDGDAPCALKRLALAIPPWVKSFPYKDHPKSDVQAVVVFEQDNPRKAYSVKCSDVAAIHKFIGCQ